MQPCILKQIIYFNPIEISNKFYYQFIEKAQVIAIIFFFNYSALMVCLIYSVEGATMVLQKQTTRLVTLKTSIFYK